jgi:hypothetical protein
LAKKTDDRRVIPGVIVEHAAEAALGEAAIAAVRKGIDRRSPGSIEKGATRACSCRTVAADDSGSAASHAPCDTRWAAASKETLSSYDSNERL